MKKVSRLILVLAMVVATAMPMSASVYTWSRYNLTFEVPDGGFVTYSSDTEFEVHWDEMALTINLYDKTGTDEKTILNDLRKDANGYNMYDTKEGRPSVKGFKGYYLEGTMPDGSRGLITNLLSKSSKLLVKVTVNYLYGNREAVDDIIKSITEGKQQMPNGHGQHKQKIQKKSDADKQEKQQQEEDKQQQEEEKQSTSKTYDV